MSGDSGMGSWISSRICEALDQADLARATASDLEDHALLLATVQLAEDLESFAVSLAARLAEIGDGSCGDERFPTVADVRPDREAHAAPESRMRGTSPR
jgi:hypothetical protein